MDWMTGLQRAIDYAEENLCGEIDAEEAARRAYSSAYHFQKVFGILCGISFGEYVRRRRLTRAGEELLGGGRVIDVALRYGYESPDGFSPRLLPLSRHPALRSEKGVPPAGVFAADPCK